MNIIEAYEALKQGKRVSNGDNEAILGVMDRMMWKMTGDYPVMVVDTVFDGWTIIDAPKKVEFEDCALTMHEDYAETFSYKGTSMYAEKAFRFSNFRGYLWRIKSGLVIESATPIYQHPETDDGWTFGSMSDNSLCCNWPLAERFAVRFEKR